MIERHRRRHRQLWIGLAVLLPFLLIFALRARRPPLPKQALPAYLHGINTPSSPRSPSVGSGGFANGLWLYYDEPPVLQLRLDAPFALPEPLVYWSVREEAQTGPPSAQAYLIGSVGGSGTYEFHLPNEAREQLGFVRIYSPVAGSEALRFALWRQPGGSL